MQVWLQNWIATYVNVDPNNSNEASRARRPLAAAHIQIEPVEGSPGDYLARLSLQPHYQLEDLNRPIVLVARVPKVLSA